MAGRGGEGNCAVGFYLAVPGSNPSSLNFMLVKRAQIIKRQGLGQVLKTMGVLLKDCIAGSFPGGLGSNPRRKLCLKDQWSAPIQQNSSNTKQKTGGFKTLQSILF